MTHVYHSSSVRDGSRLACTAVALVALSLLGACASKGVSGYGVGAQAERAMMAQQSDKDAAPDTPGMYLGLIDQMQSQGLYFASLAHIDAYEKQYGASPDTTLSARGRAADDRPAGRRVRSLWSACCKTPLAARGLSRARSAGRRGRRFFARRAGTAAGGRSSRRPIRSRCRTSVTRDCVRATWTARACR